MLKWTKERLDYAQKELADGATADEVLDGLKQRGFDTTWPAVRRALLRHGRFRGPRLKVEPADCPADLRRKCYRRARRLFMGDPVRHRIVEKTEDSVTFKFNRDSSKYAQVPSNYRVKVTIVR